MPSSTLSCFLALIIMENFHMAREKKLIHFPLFYYTLEDRYTWLIFPSTQFPPPVGGSLSFFFPVLLSLQDWFFLTKSRSKR